MDGNHINAVATRNHSTSCRIQFESYGKHKRIVKLPTAMKLLAFILVTIFLIHEISSSDSEEMKMLLDEWLGVCAKELDIPQEKLAEYEGMTEPAEDETATCLTACILEKSGFMKNGKVDEDMVSVFVAEKEWQEGIGDPEKVAERCQKDANNEPEKCGVAGSFAKCIYKAMQHAKESTK